jgi:hypothetical protein
MQPIMNATAPRPRPVGSLFTPIRIDDDVTIEQVTQAVEGLDKSCLQDMLALTYVLKNDRGSSSPAEELISNLLQTYGCFGGCVTPKDVEEEAEAFHRNWEGARGDAEGMAQRYPHLFSFVGQDEEAQAADAGADGNEANTAEDTVVKEEEPEPQATAESAPAEEKIGPKTTMARMMVDAFDNCIGEITSERDAILPLQEEHPLFIERRLGDALLLGQILSDWGSGVFDKDYPHESQLIAAVRGNLGL